MIKSVMRISRRTAGCYPSASCTSSDQRWCGCLFYNFRRQKTPMLSRGATFESRFQSPSLGSFGVREVNRKTDNINSPSSILLSIHYCINASTVILPQLTYYINIPTYTTGSGTRSHTMSKRKQCPCLISSIM